MSSFTTAFRLVAKRWLAEAHIDNPLRVIWYLLSRGLFVLGPVAVFGLIAGILLLQPIPVGPFLHNVAGPIFAGGGFVLMVFVWPMFAGEVMEDWD